MDNNTENKTEEYEAKEEETIQKPKTPRKPLTEKQLEQLRVNMKKGRDAKALKQAEQRKVNEIKTEQLVLKKAEQLKKKEAKLKEAIHLKEEDDESEDEKEEVVVIKKVKKVKPKKKVVYEEVVSESESDDEPEKPAPKKATKKKIIEEKLEVQKPVIPARTQILFY